MTGAGKQQAVKSPMPKFKLLTSKIHPAISYINFCGEMFMSLIARLVSMEAIDGATSAAVVGIQSRH